MADGLGLKMSAEQAAIHREMARRANDKISVFNPMDIDFKFMWDSRWYKIPNHQSKTMERYLVERAVEDMGTLIFGQIAMEKGNKMIAERKEKGLTDYLNKYDENKQVWDNVMRTDDNQRREIIKSFNLVLVEENGVEAPPEQPTMMPSANQRSAMLQIMDELTSTAKPEERAVESTTESLQPVKRAPGRPPKISVPDALEVTNE